MKKGKKVEDNTRKKVGKQIRKNYNFSLRDTILKYNCYKCNKEEEIQTTMEAKRVLKICFDCLLKYTKEQSNEYIPFVEE